jgi:hypothetical protein
MSINLLTSLKVLEEDIKSYTESANTDDEGRIKFEIISEDMYFTVWEDSFHIKSKATIKIEEMISQIKEEDIAKKITLNAVLESKEETPSSPSRPVML